MLDRVQCNERGELTKIRIRSRDKYTLTGSLVSSFESFSNLVEFALIRQEGISGTLPPIPGQLRILNVQSCKISGTVPNLPTSLTALNLQNKYEIL